MKTSEEIMNVVNGIYENEDIGLFGFVIKERGDDASYEDIGRQVLYLFKQHPEQAKLLDDMLISICGMSLVGCLLDDMEDARDYYEWL